VPEEFNNLRRKLLLDGLRDASRQSVGSWSRDLNASRRPARSAAGVLRYRAAQRRELRPVATRLV